MEIDLRAVRRQLGLRNPEDSHAVERVIAIELSAAKGRLEERTTFRDARIKEIKGGKVFFDGLTVESKSLSNHLKGCTKATFFAVTIGDRIEADLKDHLENEETPQAMVLDAIGSVACEALAEEIDGEISERAKMGGHETTTRASPGYGDWKIENQKEVLEFLKAEKIGICLTDSFLMLPRKSITAVKGWHKPTNPT